MSQDIYCEMCTLETNTAVLLGLQQVVMCRHRVFLDFPEVEEEEEEEEAAEEIQRSREG